MRTVTPAPSATSAPSRHSGDQRAPPELARGERLRHLARHAHVAGEVHPVRVQVERDARVRKAKRGTEWRPRLEAVPEPHDPSLVAAQAQFGLGAQHPVARFAADLPALDAEPAGEADAGRHMRIEPARLDHRRAAHDIERLAVAAVDPAQRQPVRVRVRNRLQHARGHDAVEPLPHRLDLLPRGGDQREVFGQRTRIPQVAPQPRQLVDPVEGDVHTNCRRKLMSPS